LSSITETSRIDGKRIAAEVRAGVARWAAALAGRGVVPGLAVVLVGDDPASQVYVRNKDQAARQAGFAVRTLRPEAHIAQGDLQALVAELGAAADVHGILVQLPLPRHLDPEGVIGAIPPQKDVDGLHPANVAALTLGREGLVPCTPAGCLELLDRTGVELAGARVVIVGRSQLVGKPLFALCLARHATVTVCHSQTRDLPAVTREAEVLVAAVGRPGLVRGDWIRPGAVVIDVGINRLASGALAGDVAFDEALGVASAITPVPGGVGPMTIAMLLRNTALAATRQAGLDPRAFQDPRGR
jgi:methylenetetrahydrofolate dehydrogenase (NADP+)/methenyltetrahydrofolate cyclohydrolase